MAQRTVALYQQYEKLRTLVTTVVSIQPFNMLAEENRPLFKQATDEDYVVATSETIFHAQGGGQPSDNGTMLCVNSASPELAAEATAFEVATVRKTPEGQILHLGRFAPSPSRPFTNGAKVQQDIDGAKRDLHSRIHTAGHILGLAVRQLATSIPDVTELKAQHYPDAAFVEFKGLIEGKHKDAIQARADDLVRQALPVNVCMWTEQEARAKCAMVPEAFEVPEGTLVRAMEIQGAGAYPCGGTHVADTGLVGKLEVRKISRQKGVSKISYGVS